MFTERPTLKAERNSEILALRRRGLSLRDIGLRFGLSHTRVDTIIREEMLRTARKPRESAQPERKAQNDRGIFTKVPIVRGPFSP